MDVRTPPRPAVRPVRTAALTVSVRWARDQRRRSTRQDRLRDLVVSIATLGLGLVVLVASVLMLHGGRLVPISTINGLTAGAQGAQPGELMVAAAGALETAT